jgi:hypothetical protein
MNRYVNAKQYHRILKRRAARAKLEAELKVQRQKKVFIADLHACVYFVFMFIFNK